MQRENCVRRTRIAAEIIEQNRQPRCPGRGARRPVGQPLDGDAVGDRSLAAQSEMKSVSAL